MKIFRTGAYESFYDLPIKVDWILTRRCNYRCSYCFIYGKGKLAPPPMPFATLTQLKAAVDNIASLNRPWYNVTLSGGEPTLHPHISDLVVMLHENLKERLNWLEIITNGSRNKDFYESIADVSKLAPISLTISIHTDHVDMTHILELIEKLSRNVRIHFSLMFNPAKLEEVYLIYDILFEYRKKFPFLMNVATLRDGDRLDPRYTKEDLIWQEKAIERFKSLVNAISATVPPPKQLKRVMHIFHDIEDNGERKIIETENRMLNFTNGLIEFNNMHCIAHASVLRIHENGACRGMICNADPCICNVYEENAIKAVRDKLIHAVKCPLNICGCSGNDHIPKFSSLSEAKRFMQVVADKQDALFKDYDETYSAKTI